MREELDTVTFAVGQGVSFWLGRDGLGQVEHLLRTHVDVLYKRDGHLCRRRVSARELARRRALWPLLFPCVNPFGRAIVRPRAKTFSIEPIRGVRKSCNPPLLRKKLRRRRDELHSLWQRDRLRERPPVPGVSGC